MSNQPDAKTTADATADAMIALVVNTHLISTHSSTRGSIVTKRAGCACDLDLTFDWNDREAQHRAHLHRAIFEAGRYSAQNA